MKNCKIPILMKHQSKFYEINKPPKITASILPTTPCTKDFLTTHQINPMIIWELNSQLFDIDKGDEKHI